MPSVTQSHRVVESPVTLNRRNRGHSQYSRIELGSENVNIHIFISILY